MGKKQGKHISLTTWQDIWRFTEAGYTRREVADILNIHFTTVQKYIGLGKDVLEEKISNEQRYIESVLGAGCTFAGYYMRDGAPILYSGDVYNTDNYEFDPTMESAAELEQIEQGLYDE